MAESIRWTLVAHRIFGAKERDVHIDRPRAVIVWRVCESTTLVHRAAELLDSENTEEQEDKHHK